MNQYTITKGQFDAIMKFKDEKFQKLSSGDPKLDKHTQKNAKEYMDFLEWIDFSQFDLIKYTGKEGSFSTIYTALWTEAPDHDDVIVNDDLAKDRISKEVGEARGGGRSARVEVVMGWPQCIVASSIYTDIVFDLLGSKFSYLPFNTYLEKFLRFEIYQRN
uniref:Uncharacterized protein n=1 Tax=Rhizophagus irregularis (strain DAOM 181602 / DAOM 197198 / MUCL 43194) TaxID=747089 RepID=U9TBB6_RHIID